MCSCNIVNVFSYMSSSLIIAIDSLAPILFLINYSQVLIPHYLFVEEIFGENFQLSAEKGKEHSDIQGENIN